MECSDVQAVLCYLLSEPLIRIVWPRRPLAWSAYSYAVKSLHGTYGRHVCAILSQFSVPSRIAVIIHTFHKTVLQN